VPRFRVDGKRSQIDIHLRVNLHPSHVTSSGLTGTIECEVDRYGRPRLDRQYAADLSVPVESLKSGIGLQDREMRRRMNVAKWPLITARVTKGEALDAKDRRYRAVATVSMRGRSRQIAADVQLHIDGDTLIVHGAQVINMTDFGISPPRLLVLRVEPEVDVRARIVAKRQRDR